MKKKEEPGLIVFEGIVMSGPTGAGRDLVSPARMYAVRYLRGQGPRIVSVATSSQDLLQGLLTKISGGFAPEAGEAWRVVARRARERDRLGRQVLYSHPCDSRTHRIDSKRFIRLVPRVVVRGTTLAGELPWSLRPFFGPRGLLCVLVHPERRHTGGGRECGSLRSSRPVVLFVVHEGGRKPATAVVVGGPRVRTATLATPDGPIQLQAAPGIRIMLAVLPGRVSPHQIAADVEFTNGTRRRLRGDRGLSAAVPDPQTGRDWLVRIGSPAPAFVARQARDVVCAGFSEGEARFPTSGTGSGTVVGGRACGNLRRTPFFFKVEKATETGSDSTQSVEMGTGVFGAAGPRVARIDVIGRGQRTTATFTPRGRAFLAILPPDLSHTELIVEAHLTDGTTQSFTGREQIHTRRE